MAELEFRLPKLAMSMVEGTIEEWHVEAGASIEEGQDILTISTDKVESALPSPAAGRIRELLVPAGETVPVGTLLAVISQ